MPRDGTELLTESRTRGSLPDGFKTTLIEEDRLRQLEDADTDTLSETVADFGSYTLTESHVVRQEVQKALTSYITPERTIELPATGLEFENIQSFAAYYKGDSETPSGTIKDPKRATTDDIVFSFATPEVYETITGNATDTYKAEGLSGGSTLDLIGDAGLPENNNTSGATLELESDEMLYFTGDFIDLSEGQSVMTKIQWADIDGQSYGPDNGILSNRLSGAHIFTGQGAWVKSTMDLDIKVYEDGDAEIVPIAYYMAPGTKAPELV